MIVMCEGCAKKYRLAPEKIKGEKARFKCKTCGHLISVSKPAPSREPQRLHRITFSSVPSELKSQLGSEEKPEMPHKDRKVIKGEETGGTPSEKKIRFGLTTKVIALMLLVSLVPLGILWGITFKKNSDRIREDTERLMVQISTGLAAQVDEWIDKNLRVLKALADMPDIKSMDRAKQEPLLRAVQEQYPWMYLVFTVGPDGLNVARNDGKPLKDYSDRQYYKDIIGGKALTWQTLIGKTSKKPAIVLAVPIRREGKVIGIMANAMKLDDISKRVATWKQGKSGFAFLVDEKGKVVAHQRKEFVLRQENLSRHPLIAAFKHGQRGPIYFTDLNGQPTLGHVKEMRYGWTLAIQQEEKEAFEILHRTLYFAVILLGGTVVVVFVVALFSGRAIATPIRKLTEAANRISVGELDTQIQVKSKDEIGALAEAIGRMQESIRLSIERFRRRR